MTVLITGGAGYIGSHCNKHFAKMGINTIILDSLLYGHKEAVVSGKLIVGDIGNKELLDKIFRDDKIEAVIHVAALADVADSVVSPSKYYDVNVKRMLTLLNAMVDNSVKHIVFSSSAATFGEPEYIPIDEKHKQEPVNPYGMTKLIGEKILMDYERAYGIKFCTLRYFNAAGADPEGEIGESHNPENHILPLIFKTALGIRDEFNVYGSDYDTKDGTCLRDYVHVTDLARAHYFALQYLLNGNGSTEFNLGNNVGYTVMDIINNFQEISGIVLNYKITERRVGDPAKLVAANKKAKNLLGWNPEFSDIGVIIKGAWEWEKQKKY